MQRTVILARVILRWHNHLDPNVRKDPVTPEEEQIIFEQYDIHENKWATIAAALQHRRDSTIKNYFYATLRRKIRRICKLLRKRNVGTKNQRVC